MFSLSLAARMAAVEVAAELGLPPDAADKVMKMAEDMVDFDSWGEARASEEIIDSHNRQLRRLEQWSSGDVVHSSSNNTDVKPAEDFTRPPPYASLLPITCLFLQPQTRHGCACPGWLTALKVVCERRSTAAVDRVQVAN